MGQKRKKQRQQARRRAELAATVTPTTTAVETPVATLTSQPEPASTVVSAAAAHLSVTDAHFMRRDLGRVAIVVSLIIAVLVAMVITNHANGWLDRIASQLYHWLRLG